VGTFDLVVLPRRHRSAAWRCAVRSPNIVAVSVEWSAVLALHCSRMSAHFTGIECGARTHVLQAHDNPDVNLFGDMRACIGNMREASCTGRLATLFFMLEAHGPQETARHEVAAPEPSRQEGGIRSHRTQSTPSGSRATAHAMLQRSPPPYREIGFEAVGHVVHRRPPL
jgi:hypothetical protein